MSGLDQGVCNKVPWIRVRDVAKAEASPAGLHDQQLRLALRHLGGEVEGVPLHEVQGKKPLQLFDGPCRGSCKEPSRPQDDQRNPARTTAFSTGHCNHRKPGTDGRNLWL